MKFATFYSFLTCSLLISAAGLLAMDAERQDLIAQQEARPLFEHLPLIKFGPLLEVMNDKQTYLDLLPQDIKNLIAQSFTRQPFTKQFYAQKAQQEYDQLIKSALLVSKLVNCLGTESGAQLQPVMSNLQMKQTSLAMGLATLIFSIYRKEPLHFSSIGGAKSSPVNYVRLERLNNLYSFVLKMLQIILGQSR